MQDKKILVTFKHKSIKEYWSGGNYTYNKIMFTVPAEELDEDGNIVDLDYYKELVVDTKILEILSLLYPLKNDSGYDVLYQYEITKINLDPYK